MIICMTTSDLMLGHSGSLKDCELSKQKASVNCLGYYTNLDNVSHFDEL
uniref:Uncharacterized protein n=1 Tax=Rhizophora mucronata TaxID=61149 RepID=A0A2P2IUJ8_RHIMU